MVRVYWIINKLLAGSPIPESLDDIKYWIKHGITLVISLVEDWEFSMAGIDYREYVNELKRHGIELIRVPVKDGYAPTDLELLRLVKIIDEYLQKKKPVLVHCYGGIGRTVTVLAAYLIYSKGLEVEEALEEIFNINNEISITDEQYMTLISFKALIKRLKREAQE